MRFKLVAMVLAVLALLSIGSNQASALSYNLTLMSGSTLEGTGSFSITGPVAGTGISNFTGSSLTALNFVIDGNSFQLANAVLPASVTFFNGSLINIAYVGALSGFKLQLDTLGLGYLFTDAANWQLDSVGTISASATPLPGTLGMMLLGLGVLGFMGYRRTRTDGVRTGRDGVLAAA
jgi:PEP-CTERM motif-containing protein